MHKTIIAIMILAFALDARPEEQSSHLDSISDILPQPLIEVEVRFLEIIQICSGNTNTEWLSVLSDAGSSLPVPDDFEFSKRVTSNELSLIMQELERRSNINLLSAPKVSTRSGKNAEIKVVREIVYPAKYEWQNFAWNKRSGEIRLVSSNEVVEPPDIVVPAVGITEFETRDAGIILNVTPTLEPDGKTIILDINTEVCELADWIDYGSTIQYVDGIFRHEKMLQPIFHSRKVASIISLPDGETAIMGGLVKEDVETQTDKTPIFGHIPLLGRLFRKETARHIKTSLLVLVTARKKPG